MIFTGIAFVIGLLLFVLLKLSDIIGIGEATMAKIDEAVATEGAKTDSLLAKVDEVIITLGELKAIVDQVPTGDPTAAIAALEAIGAKVDERLASLTTAETAADPTPDV